MLGLVVDKGALELVTNLFDLSFHFILVEVWSNEEVGESVNTFFESVVVDFELIVGVGHTGKSVQVTTELGEKLIILLSVWILLRSDKKHVLHEEGQTVKLFGAVKVSNSDINRYATLGGEWI